ncbi:MAG: acetyltransferase [Nitrosomonas sp.]|nr:MAG: acetyltransferase [Nitrosomonas sp.]
MELHAFDNDLPPALQQVGSVLAGSLISFPDRVRFRVNYDGDTLRVRHEQSGSDALWRLTEQLDQLRLTWIDAGKEQPEIAELLAALEASFTYHPQRKSLMLSVSHQLPAELYDAGIILGTDGGLIAVEAELFWQQARVWRCSGVSPVFPVRYTFSNGRRHPLRPRKSGGDVYRRYITWLDGVLTLRTLDPDTDLAAFNRWMNDPVVAEFWQETGCLAKHRDYLAAVNADPHIVSLVACLDDEPFGYFEIYWAKEDRIAPFYDVDDFDRGWHVLIGEPHRRGKPYVTAWLPSISHYLFLDDCRTQRIVIEPRADNHKMMRNLAQCGYANLKEFDFPHKRAVLNMLQRERFFSEQLWVPRHAAVTHPTLSL